MLVPRYIGWRTREYGPVDITLWPGSTSTTLEAKGFSLKTRKTRASEARTVPTGISDHPNLRSSPGVRNSWNAVVRR